MLEHLVCSRRLIACSDGAMNRKTTNLFVRSEAIHRRHRLQGIKQCNLHKTFGDYFAAWRLAMTITEIPCLCVFPAPVSTLLLPHSHPPAAQARCEVDRRPMTDDRAVYSSTNALNLGSSRMKSKSGSRRAARPVRFGKPDRSLLIYLRVFPAPLSTLLSFPQLPPAAQARSATRYNNQIRFRPPVSFARWLP